MQDQTPIVGRPRGANGRALQAEGIVWEGQVLIEGDGVDLAARLIVTANRVAFARGGAVALDAPRAWLRPAPALMPDGSLRFTIAPGDGPPEELIVVPSEGRRAAARLVSLLAGSELATPAPRTNGNGRHGHHTEPPRYYERPAPPLAYGEPLPEPPAIPPARHVSGQMPERWGATPDLNTLAVLDPDDFPSLTNPSRSRGHDFDPLPPWRGQDQPQPAEPSTIATRGAQPPAPPPTTPADGGIPRHTAWLQPIDLPKQNRRGRVGWAIRLSGLVLLLIAAALFGADRLPDNPGRDLASHLPDQTRETLGIATDDPTPTPTPTTTAQSVPEPTPTDRPAVAETIEPTTPPEPTSVALGVGADTTAEGADPTVTATATATETATQEPPPPTATSTPEPTPTPTTEEAVEAAEDPVELPLEVDEELTATPEPPTATATNTPEPAATATEEPPPTATTEPTAPPTAPPTAEPTSAPTETPEATATATATTTTAASPVPAATPSPTPGRIPPQAPTLGEGETAAPVVASGAFRYTITSALRGAELPDLALPATPGVEWVVLLVTAQNWGDETATLTMGDFRLGVTAPNAATIPLDATSGSVAQFLGFVPAYRASDAVLFAPGESHQLALVFLVDPAAERPQLLTGETAINLDGVLNGELLTPATPELIEGTVVGVVDGQTILVEVEGVRGLVRYSGVAAPTGDDCFAAEATETNRALIEGQTVWLERQRRNTAGEDALARDVWVATDEGGRQLVAEALVAQGAAVPAIKEPDTRFAAWLEAARATAETNGVGLWGACDAPPEPAAGSPHYWSYRSGWQRLAFGWNVRHG